MKALQTECLVLHSCLILYAFPQAILAAKAGAVGLLVYPDAYDNAPLGSEEVFPHNWWLPHDATRQEAATAHIGDPLTPGYSSKGVYPSHVLRNFCTLKTAPYMCVSWATSWWCAANAGSIHGVQCWKKCTSFFSSISVQNTGAFLKKSIHQFTNKCLQHFMHSGFVILEFAFRESIPEVKKAMCPVPSQPISYSIALELFSHIDETASLLPDSWIYDFVLTGVTNKHHRLGGIMKHGRFVSLWLSQKIK